MCRLGAATLTRGAAAAGVAVAVIVLTSGSRPLLAAGQAAAAAGPAPSHISVPFLANATRPDDLDYQAAECEVEPDGARMTCRFQQVFLTRSPIQPGSCLITTNRYDRVFERGGPLLWTSRTPPEGECGTVEVSTLRGEGGTRWTLETRTESDRARAASGAACPSGSRDTMSWRGLRRPLPCTTVEPGALLP